MANTLPIITSILLLLILQHSQPALGICRCADVFPSEGEINEAILSDDNIFNISDDGELRVYTSMRFFCHTTLLSVQYRTLINCMDNSTALEYPEIQLWRATNGSYYSLERRRVFSRFTTTLSLGWGVENMDLIGIWLPTSTRACMGGGENTIQLGYLSSKTSNYYQLDSGGVNTFSIFDYRPIEGPMPLLTVNTSMDLDIICLVALPIGGVLTILCCCIVCCTVVCSIRREREKGRTKGELTITHTSPTFIDEDDALELRTRPRRGGGGGREENNPYDTIQETEMRPALPPRNPGVNRFTSSNSLARAAANGNRPISGNMEPGNRPRSVTDYPASAGGIHRANRPPDLNLQQTNGPPLPRSYTGPIPPTTPPTGGPLSGTLPHNISPMSHTHLQPTTPPVVPINMPLPPTTPPTAPLNMPLPPTMPFPPTTPPAVVPNSEYVNVEPHPLTTPPPIVQQQNDMYVNTDAPLHHLHQTTPPSGGSSTQSTPPISPVADPQPLQLEHNPHFDEFDLPEDEYVIASDLHPSGAYANITDNRNSTLY